MAPKVTNKTTFRINDYSSPNSQAATITPFWLLATAYSRYSRLHFVAGVSRFSDALVLCLSTGIGLIGRSVWRH